MKNKERSTADRGPISKHKAAFVALTAAIMITAVAAAFFAFTVPADDGNDQALGTPGHKFYDSNGWEYEILTDDPGGTVKMLSAPGAAGALTLGTVQCVNSSAHGGVYNGLFYNITEIGDNVFEDKNITTVSMPFVTKLGYEAFAYSNVISVDMPLVTDIGANAFREAGNLMSANMPLAEIIRYSAFEWTDLRVIDIPSAVTIQDSAFARLHNLESVTIGNAITYVGEEAFFDTLYPSLMKFGAVPVFDLKAFLSCSPGLLIAPYAMYGAANAPVAAISAYFENGIYDIDVDAVTMTVTATPNFAGDFVLAAYDMSDNLIDYVTNSTIVLTGKNEFFLVAFAVFSIDLADITGQGEYYYMIDTLDLDWAGPIAGGVIYVPDGLKVSIKIKSPGYTAKWDRDEILALVLALKLGTPASIGFDGVLSFMAVDDVFIDAAVFDPITYAITYNLNGGTNHAGNPAGYNITEAITLEDPSRTGYVFGGWFTTAAFTAGTDITSIPLGSTGNVTLYAKWDIITFFITYDNLNGAGHTNALTYTVEGPVFSLVAPGSTLPAGYTFGGWKVTDGTGADITLFFPLDFADDVTLWAVWNEITYTITYENLKGAVYPGTPVAYTVSALPTALPLPVLSGVTGYTHAGWYETNDLTRTNVRDVSITAATLGNRTFVAIWETELCEISIAATGYDGTMEFMYRVDYGAWKPVEGLKITAPYDSVVEIKCLPPGYYDFAWKPSTKYEVDEFQVLKVILNDTVLDTSFKMKVNGEFEYYKYSYAYVIVAIAIIGVILLFAAMAVRKR
jgi:uncharacterized repeat protein (TIGR02543 family)